ncbi:unnamed protein product [Closterium sp. NIES-65]|nr:unnamed protein product [Closterium sp. NIES-65]
MPRGKPLYPIPAGGRGEQEKGIVFLRVLLPRPFFRGSAIVPLIPLPFPAFSLRRPPNLCAPSHRGATSDRHPVGNVSPSLLSIPVPLFAALFRIFIHVLRASFPLRVVSPLRVAFFLRVAFPFPQHYRFRNRRIPALPSANGAIAPLVIAGGARITTAAALRRPISALLPALLRRLRRPGAATARHVRRGNASGGGGCSGAREAGGGKCGGSNGGSDHGSRNGGEEDVRREGRGRHGSTRRLFGKHRTRKWLRAATRNPIQSFSSHRLVSASTTARRARAMSAVDAAWQRLKAATAPAAMAGSRLSAASAAAPPAQPRGDGGGSAIAAALDGGAAGSADLAVQATAGNPGETVKLRDARVELILTQRLRQRGAAQTASGGSAAKKPVPVSGAREVQCVVGVEPGLEAPYRSSPRVSHTSWVWDLGLRPLPHSAPESDAAGSDARGERSSGKAAGGAEGALGSAERGGAGQAEGRGDDGVREGGNMEVDEGNGRRSGEGNKEGDVARENTTAAAAAGAERAAAAAAALRATRAAAGGAVVDDSKVQVREVVDFAGEAVEVVRVLDARSKEAAAAKRKADMQCSPSAAPRRVSTPHPPSPLPGLTPPRSLSPPRPLPSLPCPRPPHGWQALTSKGLDAILAQMEKKKKLSSTSASTSKGLDAILAQMEKKKKLNILDKSRKVSEPCKVCARAENGQVTQGLERAQGGSGCGSAVGAVQHWPLAPSHSIPPFPNLPDWSEYKEGTGVVEELEEYRRSGATYTEKRAFLGQADLREYERERDAKLAAQARRARPGGVD